MTTWALACNPVSSLRDRDVIAIGVSGIDHTDLAIGLTKWIDRSHFEEFPYSAKGVSDVLKATLDSASEARFAVVELGYFDIDSRSEQAAISAWQSSLHQSTHTERVHLFQRAMPLDGLMRLLSLSPEDEFSPDEASFIAGYLGYIVLRRDRFRITCGRTLIRPPESHERLHLDRSFANRVRTAVSEEVNLFGLRLVAAGVPFIEQDGHVTVCAHAAAWMAHYTAVLRGLIPRIPVGEFHDIAARSGATTYPYPSPGLLDAQVFAVLDEVGLPPQVTYISDLEEPARAHPLARAHLADESQSVHWLEENFTSAVARYLNSGLPVLIATTDGEAGPHVMVACGYIRSSALRDGTVATGDDPVVALIVNDDARGPYTIQMVGELLLEMTSDDPIIVPLPPGVYLRGQVAELFGADSLHDAAAMVENSALGSQVSRSAASKVLFDLKTRQLASRSYLAESGEFKASFAMRCQDHSARRIVALASLPRYIWVVEVIDRRLRSARPQLHPVIGEVILDASAVSLATSEVVLLHIPGYIASLNRRTGAQLKAECASTAPYPSGRWRHLGQDRWPASDLARRVKMVGR